jgi:hypothetical protein
VRCRFAAASIFGTTALRRCCLPAQHHLRRTRIDRHGGGGEDRCAASVHLDRRESPRERRPQYNAAWGRNAFLSPSTLPSRENGPAGVDFVGHLSILQMTHCSSQPPRKPARLSPATMWGERRMMFQINPVR